MKALSIIVLLACFGVLVVASISAQQRLPEQIASHFDGSGDADGWMPRSSFLVSMFLVGVGIPAIVSCVMYGIRLFSPKYLNVPNSAYWRDPMNYRTACDFLFHSSLWFASAFMLWQAFFAQMVVSANQVSPPHLDSSKAGLLTVPLIGFTFVWILIIVLRFVRTK